MVNNFMTGCLTTLGVRASLSVAGWQVLQDSLLNVLVSLAGGLLSSVVIAWLQRRWKNRETGQ